MGQKTHAYLVAVEHFTPPHADTRAAARKWTQTTHMQKSFVERARHVSVSFGANSPLLSHRVRPLPVRGY